jgi:hypothetical protein
MDDIRRPQQPQRRDYTAPTPQPRPAPGQQPLQPSSPYQAPTTPQPAYEPPAAVEPQHIPVKSSPYQSQPSSFTQPQPQPAQYQPAPAQPAAEPQFYRPGTYVPPPQPQAQPKAAASKVKKSPVLKIITGLVILVTGASLGYFGYSLKSSASGNSIPPKIVQQAGFTVYFPSPMPNGYTYMKDTATFQIGQVFYKFANGTKRVTVNEQPLPASPPKLDLPGYQQFDASIGKATVGTNFGVSSGEVIAGKTLISLNSSGGVTQDEIKAAINNLKNIGSSSDKKQ